MSVQLSGLDAVRLDPGTNVLVTGPVLSGKGKLVLSLLSSSVTTDDGVVYVSTRSGADTIFREYDSLSDAADVTIVDCVTRSFDFGRRSDEQVTYVSDPGDLTGVGIAATQALSRLHRDGRDAVFGLHSLSTMVMYADLRRVFQFLHVLTGRLSTADCRGIFAIDDSAVKPRELDILTQPFDARIDVRENDGRREFRLRGDGHGPRTWTPMLD